MTAAAQPPPALRATSPSRGEEALKSLQEAADTVRLGWIPPGMVRADRMQPMVRFPELPLVPGEVLEREFDLDLPESIGGVALEGDPLWMTIESLMPVDVYVDGRPVFSDHLPVAAGGAAMFEAVPAIRRGSSGRMKLRYRAPDHQLSPFWNLFTFSTPGLQRRFEQLDLTLARLKLASALAQDDEDREALAEAAALVPDDLDGVAAALQRFDSRAKALRVHLIGHTHIDINWLWTWPDTVEIVRRDFRSILSMLDDYPELTFTHSQPVTYEIIRQHEPELFQRVLEHIRSGRWECATLQWAETDSNIPSGESHVRQLQEAVAYSRDVLGVTPKLFFAPDTFGHAGNVPQVAAEAGAELYYHHRANPGLHTDSLWPIYRWQGQGGGEVLGVSTPIYGGFITATALVEAAVGLGLKHGHQHAMYFHGVINHGGGPTRLGLDVMRRLQDESVFPTLGCGTVGGYAAEVLVSGAELPVHHGESMTIWEGCYTTHADVKRANRHGESLLGTAETLAALAGLDRSADLQEAWRKVLFNQFHDIIDGTAIHESYLDVAKDFEAVRSTAASVTEAALDALEGEVARGAIAVTNPLGFDRTDVVVVPEVEAAALRGPDGVVVPAQVGPEGLVFVATVPAFSTVAYELVDAEQASVLKAREDNAFVRVDTPYFEARVRRDSGIITYLFDKRAERQLVGHASYRWADTSDASRSDLALNVFQILDEEPHGWAAWDLGKVRRETILAGGATTTVREAGPVRVVLEVVHPFRASELREEIVFYRDLARIDFRCSLDWREPASAEIGMPNLKVSFNPTLDPAEAWYETPFGAVRRPADGREGPAQRWADVGGPDYGVAVLNESKYGYDALGARLRLTLVRTAYNPDADSDGGHHEFAFALVPHLGDWRAAGIPEQGAAFNQPLIGRVAAGSPGPEAWRPRVEGSGVLVSSLKRAGDSFAIRMYECLGREASVTVTGGRVFESDVLERRGAEVAGPLTFRPWQVRTVLVEA